MGGFCSVFLREKNIRAFSEHLMKFTKGVREGSTYVDKLVEKWKTYFVQKSFNPSSIASSVAIPLVESRSVFLWLPLIDPSSNAGPHGTNPNDLSHYGP